MATSAGGNQALIAGICTTLGLVFLIVIGAHRPIIKHLHTTVFIRPKLNELQLAERGIGNARPRQLEVSGSYSVADNTVPAGRQSRRLSFRQSIANVFRLSSIEEGRSEEKKADTNIRNDSKDVCSYTPPQLPPIVIPGPLHLSGLVVAEMEDVEGLQTAQIKATAPWDSSKWLRKSSPTFHRAQVAWSTYSSDVDDDLSSLYAEDEEQVTANSLTTPYFQSSRPLSIVKAPVQFSPQELSQDLSTPDSGVRSSILSDREWSLTRGRSKESLPSSNILPFQERNFNQRTSLDPRSLGALLSKESSLSSLVTDQETRRTPASRRSYRVNREGLSESIRTSLSKPRSRSAIIIEEPLGIDDSEAEAPQVSRLL